MLTRNPKQARGEAEPGKWFGYYAGYSAAFVAEALTFLQLDRDACVVDPWNGSGTTTDLADQLGYRSIGYDLNPAAVLVAKARLLRSDVRPSHRTLAAEMVRASHRVAAPLAEEPLHTWFNESAAAAIRGIERAIQSMLVSPRYTRIAALKTLIGVSPLAAYYYVALFRTVRSLLDSFRTSNPTWLRSPDNPRSRLRTSHSTIFDIFVREVEKMFDGLNERSSVNTSPSTLVDIGNSMSLALPAYAVDAIISSPPYCTRIDYAVAMRSELAVLGFTEDEFRCLRVSMLGCTIMDPDKNSCVESPYLGPACLELLRAIRQHTAHGSSTYYYQTHWQYFCALSKSLSEMGRVLRPGGRSVLVVQDSYYKELHTNLQVITQEMCTHNGLVLKLRRDYSSRNTKASVNTRRLKYRNTADATESVLVFCRA